MGNVFATLITIIIALLKTTFGNRNTVVLQSQANNTKNILQHTIKVFIEFINYLKEIGVELSE